MNEWQKGIYGEVVTDDCYKLRELKFTPDIVFDIGANIGTFTRFAKELWPDSLIVAVEPHEENIKDFYRLTLNSKGVFLLRSALGEGNIWHGLGTLNGSGEMYISSGIGYYNKEMSESPNRVERADVSCIMIDKLIDDHLINGAKSIIKIDCEGSENVIWLHKPSMDALKKIDYICIELHYYALIGGIMYDEMVSTTNAALKEFEETHDCRLVDNYFFALKKGIV